MAIGGASATVNCGALDDDIKSMTTGLLPTVRAMTTTATTTVEKKLSLQSAELHVLATGLCVSVILFMI